MQKHFIYKSLTETGGLVVTKQIKIQNNIEHRTLGYSLNDEEAPKRLMYKFKKDIFGKLKEDYGI